MAVNPHVFDPGYLETEAELLRLENELHELYRVAADETQETAMEYLRAFTQADEVMRERVQNGDITAADYRRWRTSHILTARQFQEMAQVVADELLSTQMIAASIINGYMPEVYAINFNYATYSIEHQTGITTLFTLYNRQAVERIVREHPDLFPVARVDIDASMRWSKQRINSAAMQSIVQGDSIHDLAARLRMVSDMDENASIRNARTMTTSAQNGGRLDAMRRAQDMGAVIRKQWIATLDSHTRAAHREMDGQVQDIDGYFHSELGKIRFPGDPEADPANVYNCRCCLVDYDPMFPVDASDITQRWERLRGMSYEEWKQSGTGRRRVNPDNPAY